jgi:hypothetical protein
MQAPWTEIGTLQQDIMSLKRDIHNKADNHEISSINSRLDSLERAYRDLSAQVDGLLSRLQTLEEGQARLEDVVSP